MPYTKSPRTFYQPYHSLTRVQKWRRRKQAKRDHMVQTVQTVSRSLPTASSHVDVEPPPDSSDECSSMASENSSCPPYIFEEDTYGRYMHETYKAGEFVNSSAEDSDSDYETTAVQSSTSLSSFRENSVKYTAPSMKHCKPQKCKFLGPTAKKPQNSTYGEPLYKDNSDHATYPAPLTGKWTNANYSPNMERTFKQGFTKPSVSPIPRVPKMKSEHSSQRVHPDELELLRCDIYGNSRKLDNITSELHRMHQEIKYMRKLLMENFTQLPVHPPANSVVTAASNLTELSETIENLEDYKWLGKMVDGKTLRHTIRNFLKMFLTRELGMQFTWTGKGDKRTSNSKISFRDHKLRAVLDRVLQHTAYKESKMCERKLEVKTVLAGASDWDGGRQKRQKTSSL